MSDYRLFLGGSVVVIVLFYFIYYINIKKQEGMSDGSVVDNTNSIIAESTTIMNSLEIGKHRQAYESIITNLLRLTNARILQHVVSYKFNVHDDKTIAMVKVISDLENFKISLNNSMKFLDSQ